MKHLLILFLSLYLYGLELNVNIGKNDKQNYSILTLTHKEPFVCQRKDERFLCYFDAKPSSPVFKTETVFFKIVPTFEKERFLLSITPKYKSSLFSFERDMYQGYEKPMGSKSKAKKWVVIGYQKSLPFITPKESQGLNFPIEVESHFFVGAIDVEGEPLEKYDETADVKEYFSLLDKKKFGKDIDEEIRSFENAFPKSVFLADVQLLKLQQLDQYDQSETLIEMGKKWIKNFSSNEKLSEVLLLIAKNYSKIGFSTDSVYFYQRLFDEYPSTRFAHEGMVYLADQLYSSGDAKKAFALYNKALLSAKDKKVTSLAGSRLAQRYMDRGDINSSVKFYRKVFNDSSEYLTQNIDNGFALAKTLASHNAFNLALDIGKEVLKKTKKFDEIYEELIYSLAYWSYEAKNYLEAKEYMELYLEKFEDFGIYSEKVMALNDRVLFEVEDKNVTKMLQRYDHIIKEYEKEEIAHKALYKKIKLYEKLERLEDILTLKKGILEIPDHLLKDKEGYLYDIAKRVVEKSIKNSCPSALSYLSEYNVTLDTSYDDTLYACSFSQLDYKKASLVCNKYLASGDDEVLLKWLINKEKVLFAQNRYREVAKICEDICSLEKECYFCRYDQARAYDKLSEDKKLLETAQKIETYKNVKNIDVYRKVANSARKEKNDLLLFTYLDKMIVHQKKYDIYGDSPFIEFEYAKLSKALKKKKEATQVLIDLLKQPLSEEQQARAYYQLMNLTGDKRYLEKCVKLKKAKTWKSVCEDTLKLF